MEVAGDDIWASPLGLPDQRPATQGIPRSESAPQAIFDAFAQPLPEKRTRGHVRSRTIGQPFDFLDQLEPDPEEALSLGIAAMLREDDDAEGGPTPAPETLAVHSDSGLSTSSMSASSAQDPLQGSPARPLAPGPAAPKNNPNATRPPTQPQFGRSLGSMRRHPARSVSSFELAAIMNGSAASRTGISAVPAHVSGTASSDRLKKLREGGRSKNSVNWPKSVFDMIQDDFPRTPSPMVSSMMVTSKSVNNAREMRSSILNPRIPAADRRNRAQSSASVDIDFGLFSNLPEAKPKPEPILPARNAVDELRRRQPSRHRRSVSVNWTGDLPGLLEEEPMSQPSLLSTSKSSLYLKKHVEFSDPVTETAPDKISEPPSIHHSQSLSSMGVALGGLRPPASAAAAAAAAAAAVSTGPASSPVGIGPKRSPTFEALAAARQEDEPIGGPINSNVLESNFPGPDQPVHIPQPDLSGPGLDDYNFLYDQQQQQPQPDASMLPGFDAGFHPDVAAANNPLQMPNPLQAPYSGAFPSFGMVPQHVPFANAAAGVNPANTLPPGYAHTFRDGLAAAGNLKAMSVQMAAFFTAQQQLYAAQMAQMAALTNSVPFAGGAGLFNNPNFNPHLSPPGQPPLGQQQESRNPWNAQVSPTRQGHGRADGMKGLGGSAKKGPGLDAPGTKRGGRGRRGSRSHEDGGMGKSGDRYGMSMGGGVLDNGHSRSALLEEFRATSLSIGRGMLEPGTLAGYAANMGPGAREWQLSEITNHVVEFATDQHGSRFIQQKLESATQEDKLAILKHALTDAQRLMTDVFGNYVVQKLLDHGGQDAVNAISSELEGRMLSLSLHMYGCRVVQKALEVLQPSARSKLVHELNGHVLKCIRDQNGNHVIQKCVELVDPDAVQFIVDAVQGQAVVLAGHSYGCRVVQRILEHGAPHQKSPIMVEIMADIPNLIKDQYGNYVIQHVVEHGSQQERSVIMALVRGEVCQLSQHKFASNVVERCLQFGSVDEREVLVEILIVGDGTGNPSPLNHLVRDQFGNYVVQRVLDVAKPAQRDRVANILKAQVPAIKKYSYGKHIIARLEDNLAAGAQQTFHHVPVQMHPGIGTHHGRHIGLQPAHGQPSMYSHQ